MNNLLEASVLKLFLILIYFFERSETNPKTLSFEHWNKLFFLRTFSSQTDVLFRNDSIDELKCSLYTWISYLNWFLQHSQTYRKWIDFKSSIRNSINQSSIIDKVHMKETEETISGQIQWSHGLVYVNFSQVWWFGDYTYWSFQTVQQGAVYRVFECVNQKFILNPKFRLNLAVSCLNARLEYFGPIFGEKNYLQKCLKNRALKNRLQERNFLKFFKQSSENI